MSPPEYYDPLGDDDDTPFMDDSPSFDIDPSPSASSHSTRQFPRRAPASSVSGSTGLSYPPNFSRMLPPPSRPSKPSPDTIGQLTYDDLLHNPVFLNSQQKIADLEHTVSMMVCELVEVRRMPKFSGVIRAFFFSLSLLQLICTVQRPRLQRPPS
jgi:hypothetical protein